MRDVGLVADMIEGIPHPGECRNLIGHDTAVTAFLENYASGKMHHAHLVTGAKGIGKATFALRMASHLFRYKEAESAPTDLFSARDGDPIDGKIAARSHPNLLHMTRPWDEKAKKFKTKLTIDEVRETVNFFGTSRGEEGWRVAIVDAVDDMNENSSNALLKILEEPPERTVFFVLSHSPAKVMATIRSRCQQLVLKPLSDAQVLAVLDQLGLKQTLSEPDLKLLARLAMGSVRRAIILSQEDGLGLYKSFSQLTTTLPRPDWTAVHTLADTVVGRGKEDKFRLFMSFAEEFMEGKARAAQEANGDITILAHWAEVWEKTRKSMRIAEAYNLDKKQVVLNLFQDMGEASRA